MNRKEFVERLCQMSLPDLRLRPYLVDWLPASFNDPRTIMVVEITKPTDRVKVFWVAGWWFSPGRKGGIRVMLADDGADFSEQDVSFAGEMIRQADNYQLEGMYDPWATDS